MLCALWIDANNSEPWLSLVAQLKFESLDGTDFGTADVIVHPQVCVLCRST